MTLTKEDLVLFLNLLNQATFKGAEAEEVASIKIRVQEAIKAFPEKASG